MKYPITYFRNFKDNVVSADMRYERTWEELVEDFSTHAVTPDKDTLMFTFAEFVTEDYKPAMREVYAKNQPTGEFTLKLDANGNTQVGRYKENIKTYSGIVFDYDGKGTSLAKIVKQFSGLQYLCYTSYNHAISGVEKCRVILPFRTPCPADEWLARRDDMLTIGGDGVDNSSLSSGRAFYTPSHPAGAEQHAMAWSMDGALLDWQMFKAKPVIQAAPIVPLPMSSTGRGRVRLDTFDIVRFFKDRGLYIKPAGAGKHEVKCCRAVDHSSNSTSGTVIWEGDGQGCWPAYYCSHSHQMKSKDFWDHYKKIEGPQVFNNYCLREDIDALYELRNAIYKKSKGQK